MATENVGGIQYTVDADTSAMIKAESSIVKSLNSMVKSFDNIDKTLANTAKQFNQQMSAGSSAVKSTESTVNKSTKEMASDFSFAGKAVEASGVKFSQGMDKTKQSVTSTASTVKKQTDSIVNEINDIPAATTKAANSSAKGINSLNTQVSGTAKAVRSARPDMQNMSYQLQDMAVQAQMGTSAFVIVAQQLPQMLVGMGAWAGAIGVAVTVLGLLATTTIDTTKDLEKIEKSVERVKAIMTVGAHGVTSYTEEMRKLGTLSQDIVKIKLANALAEQENALRNMGGAAREAYEQALPFYNFTKGSSSSLFSGIVDDKDVKNLGAASPEISKARSGIEQLTTAVRLLESGGEANLATGFKVMTSALDLLSDSAAQNTDKGRELIASLTSLSEEYTSSTIRAKALNDVLSSGEASIKGNADALQSFLKEMHMSNTLLSEGERAALKLKLAQDGLKDSEIAIALAAYDYNQELVAQNELTEAAVEADKKRKKSLDDVNDSLDSFFEKENSDSNKKQAREEKSAVGFAQGIVDGGKSESELFAEEQQKLFDLRQKGLIDQELYDQAVVASVKDRNEQIKQANENQLSQQALFTESQSQLLGSLGNLFGAYADNMEVDDKKSFEKKKKFQTAQALINTAMAVSNALAAAPPPVNIALAGAAGIMGAMQVSAIQNQQYSGAREFGGPVTAGKSYLVGERGPEMFTPGTSGGITSNSDMSGSSGVSVNINNYSGQEVTQNYDEVKKIVTVEIGKQIAGIRKGTSQMSKAMKGTMTTKGRATKV